MRRAVVAMLLVIVAAGSGGCELVYLPMMMYGSIKADCEIAAANGRIEVAGRVVDEAGLSIENVEVAAFIWGLSRGPCFGLGPRERSLHLTASGDFDFPFDDCNSVTLVFCRPGYEPRAMRFSFADKPAATLGPTSESAIFPGHDDEKEKIDFVQVGPKPLKVPNLTVVMKSAAGEPAPQAGPVGPEG
jgi:hypothetical protein